MSLFGLGGTSGNPGMGGMGSLFSGNLSSVQHSPLGQTTKNGGDPNAGTPSSLFGSPGHSSNLKSSEPVMLSGLGGLGGSETKLADSKPKESNSVLGSEGSGEIGNLIQGKKDEKLNECTKEEEHKACQVAVEPCHLESDELSPSSLPLPKNIQTLFQNFTLHKEINSSEANYIDYHAHYVSDKSACLIRVLNTNSKTFKENRDLAITLYFQEIFYLCSHIGAFLPTSSASQHSFLDLKNFSVDGDNFAFVIKDSRQLSKLLLDKNKSAKLNAIQMIMDTYESINYIQTMYEIPAFQITPHMINSVNDASGNCKFFLSDWTQHQQTSIKDRYVSPECVNVPGAERNRASEIYALGLIGLEVAGLEEKSWKLLPHHEDPDLYEVLLNAICQKTDVLLNKSGRILMGNLIKIMLIHDPKQRVEHFLKRKQIWAAEMTRKMTFRQSLDKEYNLSKPIQMEKLSAAIKAALEAREPENVRKLIIPKVYKKDLTILKHNKTWINLEHLVISGQLGDTLPTSIAANISWKNLWRLSLLESQISDEGLSILAANSTWSRLEELVLSKNNISFKGVTALSANAYWKKLKVLDLSRNKLDDKSGLALASNKIWEKLQLLDLSFNQLESKGAASLSANISWTSLRSLDLSHNNIGTDALTSFCTNKSWMKLEELGLAGNDNITRISITELKGNWKTVRLLTVAPKLKNAGGIFCNNSIQVPVLEYDLLRASPHSLLSKYFNNSIDW